MLPLNNRRRLTLIGAFFLLAFLLAPLPALAQLFDLSEEDEIKLGQEAAKQVEAQQSILKDQQITAYVDALGQKLVRYGKRPNLKYAFKVADTDEINAFALPGGFVYVNRGLLAAAGSESELAGVLGHELGHVAARHSAEQMKKALYANMGLELLGSVLGNRTGMAVTLAKVGAQLGANAGMMKFSRDDERQADQLGLETVCHAGYDPNGMITFFEKLEKQSKTSPSKLQLFFSTHPNTAERVENISKQMKELPPRKNAIVTTSEFKNMKKRLAKLPPPPPPKPQTTTDKSGKQ